MRTEITAARLRELLHYEPSTGFFTWLIRPSQAVRAGDRAGYLHHGYIELGIDGLYYGAHRLAVLYMTGAFPVEQTDHRNGDRADNRWDNLRPVTKLVNSQNLHGARSDSTTGLIGVSPADGRFRARITVNGKRLVLGKFDTPESAHAVYLEAKRRLHPGCTI